MWRLPNLEGKSPDLAFTTKPNKDSNQSDGEFDIEVFEWKENAKTVFIMIIKKDEGNKKLYLLFTGKFNLSLNIKLEGTKGYDKAHTAQDGIKPLDLIRSVVCVVEAHLQGTWDMIKSENVYAYSSRGVKRKIMSAWKNLRSTSRPTNPTEEKAYIPGLVKSKLSNMEFTDANNPTK